MSLLPVIYRDALLQKKKTYLLPDLNDGEFVFYVDGNARYYLKLNHTTDEISAWCAQHKAQPLKVIKKIVKKFDKKISGPPVMAVLFDWDPKATFEEIELEVIPVNELWTNFTQEEKAEIAS